MMEKVKTFGIKLSELRPCDHCGGKLNPVFYVIEMRHAIFSYENINSVLGMMQMCSWGQTPQALAVAEALAPGADNAVKVLDEPEAAVQIFICNKCACEKIDFALIRERARASKE